MSAEQAGAPKKSEFAAGWAVLATAFFGLLFSQGTLVVYPFGVFFRPLTEEFGWSRGEVAGALTATQVAFAIAGPLHGVLIDKIGVRPMLLFSIVGLCATIGSLYWLTPSLLHLYACFMAISLLAATASPIGYSRVLVGLFDRRRGLGPGACRRRRRRDGRAADHPDARH